MSVPNLTFLVCLEVARLVRLVRLARLVRLVRSGGAIRSDQYRTSKTGDILKYHLYDDLK